APRLRRRPSPFSPRRGRSAAHTAWLAAARAAVAAGHRPELRRRQAMSLQSRLSVACAWFPALLELGLLVAGSKRRNLDATHNARHHFALPARRVAVAAWPRPA